jgi:hypothetical protein
MTGVRAIAIVVTALIALAWAPAPAAAWRPPGVVPPEAVALAARPVGTGASALPAAAPASDTSVVPVATAIVPGSVNRSSLRLTATYTVKVRLGIAARTIRGWTQITARNDSGAGIDRIELNTVMPRLGRMRLGVVTVDGTPVDARVDDQTIIVPLGGVLPAGASTTVRVGFGATLRSSLTGSSWLFTRVNGISNLYRWIPWVSRATPFDRPNHGDPFVTPVSPAVRVAFITDVPVDVATTGRRVSVSADGLTQVFEAEQVRDVTTAIARSYRSASATVGDTVVRVHYRSGAPASSMLSAAKRALTKLEARLGPYPYPVLKIVQSAGGYGMEGPGVVWIPTGVSTTSLAYLVTHEVAHQWFYGLVGNDQARNPFADEAMTDFVARHVLGLRRASRCATGVLDRSIYAYSEACYYERIYIQGGNLIDDARRRMGSTAFWAAVRGYLDDNRWGLSSTPRLLEALDDGTPLDLASWWAPRFPRYD